MKDAITVDICLSQDYPAVLYLLRQLFSDKGTWTDRMKKTYDIMLESEDYVLLCARYEERVVGFCSMTFYDDLYIEDKVTLLTTLIVDESCRGRGIGTALLDEVETISRKKGTKSINLESSFHREEAHRFYESAGFTKWAFYFSKEVAEL